MKTKYVGNNFNQGADIHASTAAKLFKISIEEVSKIQKYSQAKPNFGIIYGQGAFCFSRTNWTFPFRKQKAMIDAYYETYPRLHRSIWTSRWRKHVIWVMKNHFRQKTPPLPISTPIILLYVAMQSVML